MFYHLSFAFKPLLSGFNVIHYVTFRALASLLTMVLFSICFGGWYIKTTSRFFRSKARNWTPETHKEKDGMPTMGGIFIIGGVLFNILLWSDLTHPSVWIFLFNLCAFGVIGFWDDWYKIRQHKGISARTKFIAQCSAAALVVLSMVYLRQIDTSIVFPFFKSAAPDLGWLYIPFAMAVLVGTSNAVNLTDGLDGLAIGSLLPNFATYTIICYLAGNIFIANYLHIPFTHTAELSIIGCTLIGASLGFLWYNAYPAQVFMGDVGSLSLGASLAFMALMTKQELLLIISGALFVIETISVILQIFTVKAWNRRLFKMAPIHHHFELLGWPESKITVRFAIISIVLCLLTLMTLKIR